VALVVAGAAWPTVTVGIPGETADDNFGFSLARAGDLNGDGVDDLAVGAIYNDQGGSAAGKVSIFFGGRPFDTGRDLDLVGEAADDHFGVSVAGAGDVNGDGFDDLIVGARLNDRNGSAAGAAYIFFGGPSMDAVPDVVLVGEAADDWFGQSVAGAGDVNGDGYADVIVGAPYNDRNGSAAGAAYLFLGGPRMDNVPDLILTGEGADDQFGWSVGGGGDVDGDGLDDMVVGARLYPDTLANGRAYLFLGGRPPDGTPDVLLDGEAVGDWFGSVVAVLPDMNGDGRAEIGVGAPFADPVVGSVLLNAAGKAYVYLGASPLSKDPSLVLHGTQSDEQLGNDLRGAGDVNGDRRGDLLVGSHFFAPSGIRAAGKVSLYLGGDPPDDVADLAWLGEAKDDQFGHAVAGADLNGEGLSESLASAVYNDQAGSGAGKAYVIFLDAIGVGLAGDQVRWSPSFPFDAYNLYRGGVSALASGTYGSCLATGIVGTGQADPALPDRGSAFLYLVTGVRQGTESLLGFDSSGQPRPNTVPCP
jgi:FG-GAP repeat